jgi:ResB-like family
VVTILDKLLEVCASLKLAIVTILSLAFYLGAATCYEARYGTRAVQEVIYGSQPFILLMSLLAINVMAAVLVRYPWKRKQTGFIITHCGIEILLLGCLLSFRFSVDGKLSLEPQQKSEVINLNDEEVSVTLPDAGGVTRRHVFPIQLWKDAGYPGLSRFLLGAVGLANVPEEPRWQAGHVVSWPAGPDAKLEVLDWLPAAVGELTIKPSPDGFPAAIVHLGGHLPNGMPMDQTIPLLADGQGQGMVRPFGGTLELDLWKARSDAEVNEFLHPPLLASLPEMGRVALWLNGKRYTLDVTQASLGKTQTLGDSGYAAGVDDYVLHAPPPQLPENHGQDAMATEPIDPQISLHLTGPNGTRKFLLAAWHPQFMADLDSTTDLTQHGMASPDDPLIWYWHPQTYFTTKEGTRGRLELLQSPDGKLYAHLFKLQETSDQKPDVPFEVQVGKEMENFWLNISLAVTQHSTSGVLTNEYRAAHVTPQQMEDHPRAIKVALTVDGQRQETWIEREDENGPVQLSTPRGTVALDYGFKRYELGFAVGLNHAEQTNDPGSDSAAAYTSEVTLMGTDNADGAHVITMNEPLTVAGLTFYQAGFQQVDGIAFSTLSVRHDPGWIIKYIGCALIVGGIFTMFYMKAYFQKTPAAAATKTPAAKTTRQAQVAAKSV